MWTSLAWSSHSLWKHFHRRVFQPVVVSRVMSMQTNIRKLGHLFTTCRLTCYDRLTLFTSSLTLTLYHFVGKPLWSLISTSTIVQDLINIHFCSSDVTFLSYCLLLNVWCYCYPTIIHYTSFLILSCRASSSFLRLSACCCEICDWSLFSFSCNTVCTALCQQPANYSHRSLI